MEQWEVFSAILLNKSLQVHFHDRKHNFEEKKLSRQNLHQDSTFSAFNKDQNEHQNFEKLLQQKRHLNFPNFVILEKIIKKNSYESCILVSRIPWILGKILFIVTPLLIMILNRNNKMQFSSTKTLFNFSLLRTKTVLNFPFVLFINI